MQYVTSFVSNFSASKLCLGFKHDVVYCSTLLFCITLEYWYMTMYWSIWLTVDIWAVSSSWLLQVWCNNLPWQYLWTQICVTYYPCLTLGLLFSYSFFFNFFLICSEFCHTLKWNSHGFTCVPHPDPTSHLPLHPLPLGLPSAPGPSHCLMHPTWTGDLFHPR